MTPLVIYAGAKTAVKVAKDARKTAMGADKFFDWLRDWRLRKYGINKKPAKPAAAVALLLVCLCVSGCATSSIQAIRATGQEPTKTDRVVLPVCDGVSRFIGWLPFCGGQD